MHEMSLMSELFKIIQEYVSEYNLSKVSRVMLKIGEMTCVEDSSLEYTFHLFARGTEVEGAELVLKRIDAVCECQFCGERYKVDYTDKLCPACRNYNYNLISGDELLLESLEGEEEENDERDCGYEGFTGR